jgi:hypothetical protein
MRLHYIDTLTFGFQMSEFSNDTLALMVADRQRVYNMKCEQKTDMAKLSFAISHVARGVGMVS